jgi:hypothetical protein
MKEIAIRYIGSAVLAAATIQIIPTSRFSPNVS